MARPDYPTEVAYDEQSEQAQIKYDREELILTHEVHPDLSQSELSTIKEYRRRMMYMTPSKIESMIYEWTKTHKINKQEHLLLCRYYYRGNFQS